MAAYVGPLLLVLFGVSGLVLLIARSYRREEASSSVNQSQRTSDYAVFPAGITTVARRFLVRGTRVLGLVLRSAARGLARLVRSLFERSPERRGPPRVAPYVSRPAALDITESSPPAPSLGVEEFQHLRESAALAGPPPAPVAERESSVPPVELVPEAQETPLALPESPPGALSLETHVEETIGGRKKVIGRVRTPRVPERQPRRRARSLPAPAPEPTLVEEERPADTSVIARLIERGELARAESALTDLLTVNPREPEAYRLLALLYLKRGDFAQVREVCEEGLRRHPEVSALLGPLGRAYDALGKYGKALQIYQRAHDVDEGNLEYLEQLLRISARMDHRPLVKVTAEKILALEPNHADAKKYLMRVTA